MVYPTSPSAYVLLLLRFLSENTNEHVISTLILLGLMSYVDSEAPNQPVHPMSAKCVTLTINEQCSSQNTGCPHMTCGIYTLLALGS